MSPEKGQIMNSGTLILPLLGRSALPGHPEKCLENQVCSFLPASAPSATLLPWPGCPPSHHLPRLPEPGLRTSSCEDQPRQTLRFLLTPPQMSSSNTEHGTLSFAILAPATQPSSQNKDSVQFRFLSPNLSHSLLSAVSSVFRHMQNVN